MNKLAKSKLGIISILFSLLIVFSILVLGKPDTNQVLATNNKANIPLIIPKHAVEVSPGIFSLGQAQDVNGRIVEGFMIIDKKENAKPTGVGGRKNNGSSCFAFLANGARWKTTEQYMTAPDVSTNFTEISLDTWDSQVTFDIFGTNANGIVDGVDSESPDGKNEVLFNNLGSTNTIAVTTVWGIFMGPPSGRELVEWDAVFNSAYPWSLSGETGKMDYQNIATHEFGHALGLGHPDDSCLEETMYRFADFGETKKRTLETGDISGVNGLYK